ncbi:MAG: hypothetical protein JWO58_3187 [Chitinophagaceae bacterium]|nr:hypothetical protein [Chitinophagaceae bacterium]
MKARAIKHNLIFERVYTYSLHPLFFIAFFLLPHSPVHAQQYHFNTSLQKAYHEILSLRYQEAEVLLDAQLKVLPDHAIALYLKNFNTIIPVFILEDKKAYAKISHQEKTIVNALARLPKNSPYYYFTQAEVKLHWGLLKLKFGDYTAAALNVRAAYKLLDEGLKKYPDFVPLRKSMALLKVIIGSIPESYTWLSDLVGLYGNLNKGIQELTAIADGMTIYNTEAKLWLVLCEHYLLGQTDHLDMINALCKSNPQNALFVFLEVSLLVHDAHSEAALSYYNNKQINETSFTLIPSFHYMLGEIYLQKGLYPQAISAFQRYIQFHKGQAYIKDSYFKIFLAYWLQGNDKEAKRYKALTLNKGTVRNDSDKQAQKTAGKEVLPDKNIYRLRLMSDGGYLKEALTLTEQMDQQPFTNTADNLEYLYRKARLYHKSMDIEQAILCYNQTITASEKIDDYFAPNSCLQLGYIYRNLNQNDKARLYFKKVFVYKHYEYKETIESKAKAGLSSLEK